MIISILTIFNPVNTLHVVVILFSGVTSLCLQLAVINDYKRVVLLRLFVYLRYSNT